MSHNNYHNRVLMILINYFSSKFLFYFSLNYPFIFIYKPFNNIVSQSFFSNLSIYPLHPII